MPSTKDIKGIVHYQNHIWFTGDGSIIEYDPQKNSIVRFSDPSKANCNSNLAIIGNHLYVPCRILTGELMKKNAANIPIYGLYKINLKNLKIEKIYTDKDGLLSRENYKVHPDDNSLWIETFEGAARLNTQTDRIEFFQKELGTEGTTFSISTIVPDKDYVWVNVTANAYSQGGLALFNKKTEKWQAFGPKELKNPSTRIDLESNPYGNAIKLIPGGIQIAYRDQFPGESSDILVENQYSYETGQWKKLDTHIVATGQNYQKSADYLLQNYPPIGEYAKDDQDGFTQIYLTGSNTPKYLINGRAFLFMTGVNHKKYFVTSNTIDVLDSSSKLPRILFKLGENIDTSRPHSSEPSIKLYSGVNNNKVLVVNTNYFQGMEGPDIWKELQIKIIDAKKDEVINEYKDSARYGWRLLSKFKVEEEGSKIFLLDENNKKLFEYDSILNSFRILNQELAK